MTFSLIATHNDFKKVFMGQVSRRLAIWSTSGRLRWKEQKKYKGKKTPLHEGDRKNKKNLLQLRTLNTCTSLRYIHKNRPSSNLTKECFSLQIVLLNHSTTNPTHYDSCTTPGLQSHLGLRPQLYSMTHDP